MFTYRADRPLTVKDPKKGIITLHKGDKLERLTHPRLRACLACGDIKEDPVITKSKPIKSSVSVDEKDYSTLEEPKKGTKSKKSKKGKKKDELDG